MKIAVVGSRDYPDLEEVRQFVRSKLKPGDTLVSGGARGVDSTAEDEAKKMGIECLIFPADWKTHGRIAGYMRNGTIVKNADEVHAFLHNNSRGTINTLDIARFNNVPHFVYKIKDKKP